MSNKSVAEVEELAERFFLSNIASAGGYGADYTGFSVVVDTETKTVTVSVDTKVKTFLGAVVGVDEVAFGTSAQATFNARDIELGLALDVTGSMKNNGKIGDLKVAAKALIDTLLAGGGGTSDIKIGLAPYAASVNAGGAVAAAVTDGSSQDGCVIERAGSDAYTDAAPFAADALGAADLGALPTDIDPFENSGSYSCPNAEVVPLSSDAALLKAKINAYTANGYTAGHTGTAWGWYLVSPEWSGIWQGDSTPKAYGTKNLIKAVVVMTDGVFNTAWKNDTSASQALELCANMKAAGVVVYTVSFDSPNHPTLMDCASISSGTGEPLYYDAANGSELNAAFQDIAINLTNLRLAR